MAQDSILFRANTQTSVFPLLSQLSTQTVIIPQQDQTFVPSLNPSEQAVPVDRGVPQLYYAHNVMPSTYGFQSVGYISQYPAITATVNLDHAHFVVSTDNIRTYLAVDYRESKTVYMLTQAGVWTKPSGAPSGLDTTNRVSIATVNGESFICIAKKGVFKYRSSNNTLSKVTLKGLSDSRVLGVTSTHGYLITWSKSGVAWSSTNDPTDFTPSDVSGAGAGDVQDAQGDVVFCQQTAYGFIIYTSNNAVSVTYSGNTNYPFNFRALSATGGVASSDMVSVEAVGTQYAYTTSGMQQVYHTGGKTVMPAVTDFLAGQIFEDFDEATNTMLTWTFNTTMRKKISLIANRYLVCSYGRHATGPMTHALIMDVVQTRMGKVKITHNCCFELRNIAPEAVETPRRSIAFLQPDGAVKVVDFNTTNPDAYGVALYGKYQLARTLGTELLSVTLENVPTEPNFEVHAVLADDGKEPAASQEGFLDPRYSSSLIKKFNFNQADSRTISLLIKGVFNLNGMVIELIPGGDNY